MINFQTHLITKFNIQRNSIFMFLIFFPDPCMFSRNKKIKTVKQWYHVPEVIGHEASCYIIWLSILDVAVCTDLYYVAPSRNLNITLFWKWRNEGKMTELWLLNFYLFPLGQGSVLLVFLTSKIWNDNHTLDK